MMSEYYKKSFDFTDPLKRSRRSSGLQDHTWSTNASFWHLKDKYNAAKHSFVYEYAIYIPYLHNYVFKAPCLVGLFVIGFWMQTNYWNIQFGLILL